jgi:hypothetical protein
MGDSISGYADEIYTSLSTKSTGPSGTTTTDSDTLVQRYFLLLDKTIFPKLTLDVTGIFEKDLTNSKSSGQEESTSTTTRFVPSATLTLRDPLYNAGIGYFLNEQQSTASRAPSVTLVNEDYQALFGWRPAGLPTMDMRFDRIDTFDKAHAITDTTEDLLTLASLYAYKGVRLQYFGTYTDTTDHLHSTETQNLNQNMLGMYNTSFFNGRLLFGETYNINTDKVTTVSMAAGGTVSVQVFPFSGLSTLSNMPTLGPLSPNPALIDGNLTVSAGIDIGLPPLGGNLTLRNIGLDFQNAVAVNDLQVWVDRTLTPAVAASFSWGIYTSPDNQNWTLLQTVFPASFGTFQNRFDIPIAQVTTRYIKVVVAPLSAAVTGASSFPNIFVTELQAFVTQTATGKERQSLTNTTQISTTTARYRIFDSPLIYYDFSYFFDRGSTSAQETSTLSNGLSGTYRFTSFLTSSARIIRQDGTQGNETTTAYVYNASLIATPLPTLTDSIVVSGTDESIGRLPQSTASISLNNTAQLYKGVDVTFNAGRVDTENTDRSKIDSTIFSAGANIVPHTGMTWTFILSETDTSRSIPGGVTTSLVSKNGLVTLAYTPVKTLYLLASINLLEETGQRRQVLQTYGGNWTPFPYGALQLRFSYNETAIPEQQLTTKTISPGVRYKINSRSFLDLSYQSLKSQIASQITDSTGVTLELEIFL